MQSKRWPSPSCPKCSAFTWSDLLTILISVLTNAFLHERMFAFHWICIQLVRSVFTPGNAFPQRLSNANREQSQPSRPLSGICSATLHTFNTHTTTWTWNDQCRQGYCTTEGVVVTAMMMRYHDAYFDDCMATIIIPMLMLIILLIFIMLYHDEYHSIITLPRRG